MLPEMESLAATKPHGETFSSILSTHHGAPMPPAGDEQAVALADLQLNRIIAAVTAGREHYDLVPFFCRPLRNVEEISYRHQIISDLQGVDIRSSIDAFAHSLQDMRMHLIQAEALRYRYQRQAVFAVALERYCSAVEDLLRDMEKTSPTSPGLLTLREFVREYASSDAFRTLGTQTREVLQGLTEINYCVRIRGSRVTVSRYEREVDHAAEVQDTFKRFQQSVLGGYENKSRTVVEMDHIEAMILERVAKLFPDIFASLDRLFQDHQDFADPVMLRFDREIQFYLAYLDHIAPLIEIGLHFCLPAVSASKELCVENTFDLALAHTMAAKHQPVVCNDFRLHAPERIFVVSGPNQGGKTTFARTVGQLHYLAALGLPVPGTRAELFVPDKIFTHFERGENTQDLRGKLMDDLVRIHSILQQATPDSLVILNEIFTSTTLADAIDLGGRILDRITTMGLVCVCVTFVDELASLSPATVSMVSTVDGRDPVKRTFKVIRKPADGLAYAMVLARKYRLTHDQLKERILP